MFLTVQVVTGELTWVGTLDERRHTYMYRAWRGVCGVVKGLVAGFLTFFTVCSTSYLSTYVICSLFFYYVSKCLFYTDDTHCTFQFYVYSLGHCTERSKSCKLRSQMLEGSATRDGAFLCQIHHFNNQHNTYLYIYRLKSLASPAVQLTIESGGQLVRSVLDKDEIKEEAFLAWS